MEGEEAGARALPPFLLLLGTHVELSTPSPEDDEGMRAILSDPITIRHLPQFDRGRHGWTLDEVARRREDQVHSQLEHGALVLNIHCQNPGGTGTVLAGSTGFRSVDFQQSIAECGIVLHHTFWGKGLATEAQYLCLKYGFETLFLNQVEWITDEKNESMRGWLENVLGLQGSHLENEHNLVKYTLPRLEWWSTGRAVLEKRLACQ